MFLFSVGEKREMIMLQDSLEDSELKEVADKVEFCEVESLCCITVYTTVYIYYIPDIDLCSIADTLGHDSNTVTGVAPVYPATESAPVHSADSITASSTTDLSTPRKRPSVSGYLGPAKQRKSMLIGVCVCVCVCVVCHATKSKCNSLFRCAFEVEQFRADTQKGS